MHHHLNNVDNKNWVS